MSSSRPSRSASASGGGAANPPSSGQSKVTSFFARAKSQPVPKAAVTKSAKSAKRAKSPKGTVLTTASLASRKVHTPTTEQDDDEDDIVEFSQEFDDLPTSDDDGDNDHQVEATDSVASLLPTPITSSSPPNADSTELDQRPESSSTVKPSSTAAPFFKSPAPIVRRSRFSPPPPPQKPKLSRHSDERRPVSPLGSAAAAAYHDAHLLSSADQTLALLFGASSSSSKRAASLRRRRESDDATDQYEDDDDDEGDTRRLPKMRRKDVLSAGHAAQEVVDESMQWAVTFVSSYLSTPDDRTSARSKLRTFDLDYKYGPTVGIPRLTRWIRARDRGLEPDPHVGDLLRAIDMMSDVPAAQIARMLGMNVQEVQEVKEMAQNVFAEYGTLV